MSHCRGSMCILTHTNQRSLGDVCTCPCHGCVSARDEDQAMRYQPRRSHASVLQPLTPARRVILGFSSDPKELVEPWVVVTISRTPQYGHLRVERLEVHLLSARAFDLEQCTVGGALVTGPDPVCLAVLPSSLHDLRFAPRVLTFDGVKTIGVAEQIRISVRNVSGKPARFRANLFGVSSE